jgi:hypothetical protein
MRVTIGRTLVVAALAMSAGAGCGNGASKANAAAESQGESITAVGCPATPRADCVTIAAYGKTYDITSAGVDVSRGVGVSLSGTAAGEMTQCGIKLNDVKVSYQTLKCGAPAPPAAG